LAENHREASMTQAASSCKISRTSWITCGAWIGLVM
jgi:hypothetical protein